MAATTVWGRIRARIAERPALPGDGLRRVTVRLAAQTVGLVLVMLLALEIVVYLITRQGLVGSLENTIKDRSHPGPQFIAFVYHLDNRGGMPEPRPGPNPGPGGGPVPGNPDLTASDASSVYVTPRLRIVHHDGALGEVTLSKTDMRTAIRTGEAQCCSVRPYQGQDYLTYTNPLRFRGKIVGAVQTSISENQYRNTMNALLEALVIVAILGLLVSGAISAVLVRRAIQPIRTAVQHQRDFVADAAHELRTPLAIQRTVGEVGMADPSAEELQATVAQMLGQNQHLTRLVDDLSLLARTDTNAVSIERRPVDLSSLVSDTADELAFLAEEQGITLRPEVQSGISVMGDTVRLRQLLLILIDNALKHTPAGGSVSARLSVQGTRVRLEVADSGTGIDPDHLPRIFDRFYRADESRTGEGTGLGLAIARWIVTSHGGTIQAGNAPGGGAVFTVTLPASRGAAGHLA